MLDVQNQMNMSIGKKLACILYLPAIALVAFLGTACGGSKEEEKKKEPAASPEEAMSKKIESLTGNHSRAAWLRYMGETADVYGNGRQHQLMGIDTRDGRGVRVIMEKMSNYARPLISPDGEWIIYTNKHTERDGSRKSFKPVVHKVDWSGENGAELGKGYAVDVWQDPENGKTWVYVANLIPTDRSSMFADKLERFLLDDPSKRELVWKKTKISVDNIQLSRDGMRACCLFPWPNVGVIDLEMGEYRRNQHGCWPSMAPDDSYASWVFDGSHKSVHLFTDNGDKYSVVKINDGPGMGGHEMYHPRWSNHPRCITVTGPYKGRTIGKSGKHAEIYIGKFSDTLNSVEQWVRLTDDSKGDHYPDLWVSGGDQVALGKIGGGKSAGEGQTLEIAQSWPAGTKKLLFSWENANAQNQIEDGDSQRACGVEARGRARFGRHFEMLTGGGYFELDETSAGIIDEKLGKEEFSFHLSFATRDVGKSGLILSHENFQLMQDKSAELVFATAGESYPLGEINEGEAVHLAASYKKGKWVFHRDGSVIENEDAGKVSRRKLPGKGLVIGDGEWDGSVEGLAILGRELKSKEIEKDHAYLSARAVERKPVPRVRLQGKLIEMSDIRGVEELDTYQRALLVYTYEVEKVIEGEYKESQVAVNHWSIMDEKPLKSMPRKLGESYILEIEALADHPELESERRWFDGFAAEEYFDVTTPEP